MSGCLGTCEPEDLAPFLINLQRGVLGRCHPVVEAQASTSNPWPLISLPRFSAVATTVC
jgi:hypothetical protein